MERATPSFSDQAANTGMCSDSLRATVPSGPRGQLRGPFCSLSRGPEQVEGVLGAET